MSFKWEEYLLLAETLSRDSSEAARRSAISRAYYAAYHAARQHRAARNALATQHGSHAAVWKALRESDDRSWRKVGNQGKDILVYRRMADYDDEISALTPMMHGTIRMAKEILHVLAAS